MVLSFNPGKLGPIKVSEDNTHFLVQIHPGNRERAKKIPGRQWDGNREAWVYPKNATTFEALLEEFQKDADSFNIRRPPTKRPADIKAPAKKSNYYEFDDQFLEDEEIPSLEDSSDSQGKISSELEHIRVMLESLKDVAANQSRTIEELRETQEEATKILNKFEAPIQPSVETHIVEVLPDKLDPTKQKEIELIEKALITIACFTSGQQKSFCDWINKYKPLREPTVFVINTHEYLKKQLGKLVGDENPNTRFGALIDKAKHEELIFFDKSDPVDRPIPILFNLNTHRNRFGHSYDSEQWEQWSRSILYLINLALVWSKVVIEAEDSNEE
ncbi:hypothetical protein DSM106972_000060 [Dulcicalothrix desertica PCC 7102]|uniref:Uncharacterized protein n=1 Tax=Dulcicalothrix desertica PCC 7102 TaxID=232991 RepID=A0A433VU55_9CYAN|nr:hypothetical protein [Dulcicalothrix desertica]RUT09512.1 hypothetical protein DSM106972_000060 [Dulcicalothrix desertica PCC 7102]TWH50712.1 hypothetical protein CAL7102_05051 [Dulcicalothrix desertica PCC 7102]